MRKFSPALADALASEYVVGTLHGAARRRFRALLETDKDLAAAVARWEAGFAPLLEQVTPVAPPARVWKAIEQRIAPRAPSPAPAATSGFWRAFGMLSGGLAGVLLAAFLWTGTPATRPDADPLFVAVVMSPDQAPHMLLSMHAPDLLRVRSTKPYGGTEGKSLELWVIGPEGPRSLGLVANQGETRVRITAADPRMQGAKAFAVSLEPPGGSPTGKPTGPVLGSGAIAMARGA